jgi:hypothetical protein
MADTGWAAFGWGLASLAGMAGSEPFVGQHKNKAEGAQEGKDAAVEFGSLT